MLVLNANIDPSKTAILRNAFSRDIKARFMQIRKAVTEEVGKKDTFRVRSAVSMFETESFRLKKFKTFIEEQLNRALLSESWTADYALQAYKKGITRSFNEVKKIGLHPPTLVDEGGWLRMKPHEGFFGAIKNFIMRIFGKRRTATKMELLNQRITDNLKDIAHSISTQSGRVFIDGMVDGSSPHKIARNINKIINKTLIKRGIPTTRTEIIRTNAEAQLDGFEDLDIENVQLWAEWETTDNPCPKCEPRAGMTFTIEEARGLIPFHVACLCSWRIVRS